MNWEKLRNFGPQDPFFMEKWLSEKSVAHRPPHINRVNIFQIIGIESILNLHKIIKVNFFNIPSSCNIETTEIKIILKASFHNNDF